MNIGITYNLKQKPGRRLPVDAFEEFDGEDTVKAITRALESGGHRVFKLGYGPGVVGRLARHKINFVFNIAEGTGGRNRESHMPALLEMLGVPYTGSDPLTLALTLDKAQAKILVARAGVMTPEFRVLRGAEMPRPPFRFPLFVKPLEEGSSKGIRQSSRVSTVRDLRRQIKWLHRNYGSIPILIERFIKGREFTVAVLGNRKPAVLGIMEIRYRDPKKRDFIYSLEVKRNWRELCEYVAPAQLDRRLEKRIVQSALTAYQALGCRDISRLDFRADSHGNVFFLEANPLPGLNPVSGDVVILASTMAWTYKKLILAILGHAVDRNRKSRL